MSAPALVHDAEIEELADALVVPSPRPRGAGDSTDSPARVADASVDATLSIHGAAREVSREERFTRLFRAHVPRVARVITVTVRPQDRSSVVDDLAQETFLKAWVYLDRLERADEDDAAGRYLAAIARNTVRSHYRALGRRRAHEAPAGHDAPVWGSGAAAASNDPLAEVDEFDAHLAVIRAINDGLPDEVAQVLRLRFWEEREITEVAERIGSRRPCTIRSTSSSTSSVSCMRPGSPPAPTLPPARRRSRGTQIGQTPEG